MQLGAGHVRIIVGGGGTIAPHEIEELEAYGVERIYTPEDGRKLGLDGMIDDVIARVRRARRPAFEFGPVGPRDQQQIARTISMLEHGEVESPSSETLRRAVARSAKKPPVVGITGTGGAGKSSLTDELLMRFVRHFPDRNIAVVAMDPTRRRTGGALLGDRIRMNSLAAEQLFMRSLATRRQNLATSAVLADVLNLLKYAGFDLVVVETAGIGQSDTEIVDLVDVPMYVMTSEYGAASQLEKIDMLDFADLVALNKFEKRGAEDALRDVRKQWRRNRAELQGPRRAGAGVPDHCQPLQRSGREPAVRRAVRAARREDGWRRSLGSQGSGPDGTRHASCTGAGTALALPGRDFAATAARSATEIAHRAAAASRAQSLYDALQTLGDARCREPLERFPACGTGDCEVDAAIVRLRGAYNDALEAVGSEGLGAAARLAGDRASPRTDEQYSYTVRDREIRGDNYVETLSHRQVPKLAVPKYRDWGEQLRFLASENLPGRFPYTAGVYPYRREEEDPDAHVRRRRRTGAHQPALPLRSAGGHGAARLSTAFDSTTLYGEDPDERPDIYGRIGNSGVSICDARRREEALLGLRPLRARRRRCR